ncbi:porphobilinogen deaminase [Owenweeksia hongkongensis DSM 17368]|uniref:Hydroxymethylbilane synthase n=1 Tax=Owenweeksia hongkongensis (strain DSM 17368 / CIP 108786 / JCM 12287 / NRRL B-23963 / UST20020801) TaxID=926562 RepID=G8R8U6_OWEHD|nr:hydroxymethylbilane synthase [Owenweeksia hongkongensis]AEV32526.1 porphobilinogen deaminase [Owenweeksia hongkongensis DSM 17368]
MITNNLRIGTRDSKLAVWQAETVQRLLKNAGINSELVMVKSPADIDLITPLHQFGGVGIFTKILDDALFKNEIDIAVHSLKDYPTQSPEGLTIAAVLERGPSQDILVHKGDLSFLNNEKEGLIATGSIRRIAQWKSKFPKHQTTNLRGNVQTRLQKLADNNWNGAIFAKAGLERIDLLPEHFEVLDWMIPAPAQGTIGVGCRNEDQEIVDVLKTINHRETEIRATVERQFLRTVEGGCSAPVGAFSTIEGDKIHLTAGVFELDGSNKVVVNKTFKMEDYKNAGQLAAKEVLANGGKEIMQNIDHA